MPRKLRVGSPFDYAGARPRVGAGAVCRCPTSRATRRAVGALAARCAGALGGRTFVLTTTLRVLPVVAEAMRRSARGRAA